MRIQVSCTCKGIECLFKVLIRKRLAEDFRELRSTGIPYPLQNPGTPPTQSSPLRFGNRFVHNVLLRFYFEQLSSRPSPEDDQVS
jgi:hypothetical protein